MSIKAKISTPSPYKIKVDKTDGSLHTDAPITLSNEIQTLSVALSSLSDVNINNPVDGSLLFYDATESKWVDNVISGDFTFTSNGEFVLANTGVVVGTYGNSNTVGQFVVNEKGLIEEAYSIAIDHDNLLNFISNEHIDHSSVYVTAGDGLSGGGDLTSSFTLTVVASNNNISVTNSGIEVVESELVDGITNVIDGRVTKEYVEALGIDVVTDFAGLTDTPNSYANSEGYFLTVSNNQVIFKEFDIKTSFSELTDTPNSYANSEGYFLTVSNNQIRFTELDLKTSFSELTDTPNTYVNYGGKIVVVDESETQINYVDQIDVKQITYTSQDPPSVVNSDTVSLYVTASGSSPNREVAYKMKNELGDEIIISSILV